MKNKKLFAILTLVCFMMTLMPVAAFAGPGANANFDTSYVYTEDTDVDTKEPVKVEMELRDDTNLWGATTDTLYVWVTKKGDSAPINSIEVGYNVVGDAVDTSTPITEANGVYTLKAADAASALGATFAKWSDSNAFYVSFYAAGEYVIHMSEIVPQINDSGKIATSKQFDNSDAVVKVNAAAASYKNYMAKVTFPNDDNLDYKLYRPNGDPAAVDTTVWIGTTTTTSSAVELTVSATDSRQVWELNGEKYVVKDVTRSVDSYEICKVFNTAEAGLVVELTGKHIDVDTSKDVLKKVYTKAATVGTTTYKPVTVSRNEVYVQDGYRIEKLNVKANDVTEKTVEITLYSNADKNNPQPLAEKTFTIEPVGAIDVDKTTITTDRRGKASFKVSGKYNGDYKIYVSSGQFGFTIDVQVGSTAANTIKCDNAPTRPVDLLGSTDFDLDFTMYDVNGNKVNPVASLAATQGWYKAANSNNSKLVFPKNNSWDETVDATGYVAIVSQPSASKITNKDLTFDGKTIISKKQITAEGTYELKVTLDNGNSATVTVEVKQFQTPVSLHVEYPEAIELGATVVPANGKIYWLDANGTKKNAKTDAGAKVDLAATGYAVANFDAKTGKLTAKTDEKYVGSIITVTAVDQRYNLIATDEIKVANDAKELKFEKKSLDVNINNAVKVEVVDQDGTVVSLGNNNNIQNAVFDVSYVILDKPEGAKVYATTKEGYRDSLKNNGNFTMNLTSNKVGNVTVQAVLKYSYLKDAETQDNKQLNVVKYYTGTQIFAVGNGSTGDVVVMSIGSHEIVINDAVKTIDAAPMIQNDRTYVPFRALAEAFGATVAYDEATQAVTAELNGTTVVMTIGSATYTVNGAEKTMDVAPFISGSRTMIPVRFAAEAFGIKVIPTYNPDGSTADILFNL